jgi:hypothetical protein
MQTPIMETPSMERDETPNNLTQTLLPPGCVNVGQGLIYENHLDHQSLFWKPSWRVVWFAPLTLSNLAMLPLNCKFQTIFLQSSLAISINPQLQQIWSNQVSSLLYIMKPSLLATFPWDLEKSTLEGPKPTPLDQPKWICYT